MSLRIRIKTTVVVDGAVFADGDEHEAKLNPKWVHKFFKEERRIDTPKFIITDHSLPVHFFEREAELIEGSIEDELYSI